MLVGLVSWTSGLDLRFSISTSFTPKIPGELQRKFKLTVMSLESRNAKLEVCWNIFMWRLFVS